MRVTVNHEYIYYPNLLDRIDGRTSLVPGDVVRVINLPGCPPANTMGHCYVGERETGKFLGMVHTNSLHPLSDAKLVIARIKEDIARQEVA